MSNIIYKQELGKLAPTLEFIRESDNDKNSIQEAEVEYHRWRLLPSSSPGEG
jgi:hypothetical protein